MDTTKDLFLNKLSQALKTIICEKLYADEPDSVKQATARDIEEFIQENVSQYSLPELQTTFASADIAMGLFFEYQDAKRLCDDAANQAESFVGQNAAKAAPSHLQDWFEPATAMAFVWVPGSFFDMGSGPWDDQGQLDEKPLHEVWLDGFWISKHPVTVGQYLKFSDQNPEHAPEWMQTDHPCHIQTGDDDRYRILGESVTAMHYPIVGVSWRNAAAFSKWLSDTTKHLLRLPTEAEWEYAARSGGKPEKYAGGTDVSEVAWYADNSGGCAQPVGTKAPNGLGIFDMCGNVAEWCQDTYDKFAYRQHALHNPIHQGNSGVRVVRGGSWQYGARDVRCADRGLFVEDYRGVDLGFRVVRPA